MADSAVLERSEADDAVEVTEESERPRIYKQYVGTGVSYTFPVDPDLLPRYWFE